MGRQLVTFDWALKKLLRSKANFDILEGFLSELIKEDVTIIYFAESESNKETKDDKSNRVDIKVVNDKGEIILIELQHDYDPAFLQRLLFGSSKALLEDIKEGDSYAQINRVISISILYFDLGQGDDYIYYGKTQFEGIHSHTVLQLTPLQEKLYSVHAVHQIFPEYYLLRINQFDGVAKDSLDEWIYFLKHTQIEPHFTAKGLERAQSVLNVMAMPKEKRQAYEHYIDNLKRNASAEFERFREATLKGKIEGKIEGIIEGKLEGKLETARQMRAIGLSFEVICQATELTPSQLEADPFFKS